MQFQIAVVRADGVEIGEPQEAPTEWGFAEGLRGCTSFPTPSLFVRNVLTRFLSADGNSDETY